MTHVFAVIVLSCNLFLVASYTITLSLSPSATSSASSSSSRRSSSNQQPTSAAAHLLHPLLSFRKVLHDSSSCYFSKSSTAGNGDEWADDDSPVSVDDDDDDDDENDETTGSSDSLPLTEERKATLFQFLLRDLQVDGVPLLGIDANQVQTLQAAVWTTMAGLLATAVSMEDDDDGSSLDDQKEKEKEESSQRVCLVFEEIPMDALQAFVQDFSLLQQNDDPLLPNNSLPPELLMFRIGLVGNGVGPAITISVKLDDDDDDTTSSQQPDGQHERPQKFEIVDQTWAGDSVIQATQAFVDRVVRDSDDAIGMKEPVYRYCGFSDACHALSAFWNCICELQAKPNLDSIWLSFPLDFSPALANLLNRSLGLYRGNDVFELVHYGPSYDRSAVEPLDQTAFGHLPPISWLALIMDQHYHQGDDVDIFAQDLGNIASFQRRSPVAAVLIKRVDLLNQEAKENPLAAASELKLTDGTTVSAFGLPLLAKSLQRLAAVGADQLEASLDQEIALIGSKE